MSETYGIAAHKATPTNLIRSLIDWIVGTDGATYPASAAKTMDSTGTLARFNEIYDLARGVPYSPSDPNVDINSLHQQGYSPILMFRGPLAYPAQFLMGGATATQVFECHMTAFFYVGLESSSTTIDADRTRKQMDNATDVILRILQYHDGCFPIYDFSETPAQTHLLGMGRITEVSRPFARYESWSSDFVFYASVLRQLS